MKYIIKTKPIPNARYNSIGNFERILFVNVKLFCSRNAGINSSIPQTKFIIIAKAN